MSDEPNGRDDGAPEGDGQRHARWVVYAERQAWEPLLRLLAFAAVGTEIGEGFRVVEGGFTARELAATGVVRWCHPVTHVVPWERDGTGALAALESAGMHALPWIGFATRRHGRHAVDRLAELLPGRRLAPNEARDLAPASPVLLIAADDRHLWLGRLPRAALLAPSPWGSDAPGGSAPDELALSRAGAKLEHAWAWLDWQGERVAYDGRWLELGAFPGGMTTVLARRASDVVAVDRREAPPAFAAAARVRWLQADVGDVAADSARLGAAPFDGLVCDVNGPPLQAARAAATLARTTLRPDGLVVFTVKLPRWSDHPAVTAAVVAAFLENGVTTLGYRHLQANRQELTLAARRGQAPSGQAGTTPLR